MKLFSLFVMTSTLFLISCSSTMNRSQPNGLLNVAVRSNLEADVDVDMSKKIFGTAKHTKLLGIFDIKTSKQYADGVTYDGGDGVKFSLFSNIVEDAKSAAAYRAVVPNKADVLVAPQYVIKVQSYVFGAWKEVTAQVSGYAGKVKDIKAPVHPRMNQMATR